MAQEGAPDPNIKPQLPSGIALPDAGSYMTKLLEEMPRYGWKSRLAAQVEQRLKLKLPVKEKLLKDTLHVDQLRAEMTRVRKTGDVAAITETERSIADRIQKAVSAFPYESNQADPSGMIKTKTRNCLGASMLASSLLSEIGITHLVGDVPGHSVLVLVSEDGSVEWRDMLFSPNEKVDDFETRFDTSPNIFLENDTIRGKNKNGQKLTIADIVDFSKQTPHDQLSFAVRSSALRQSLTLFPPELGIQLQLINTLAWSYLDNKNYEEALDVFKHGTELHASYAIMHWGVGEVLQALGRYQEAADAFTTCSDLARGQELSRLSWSAEDQAKECLKKVEDAKVKDN